MRRPGAEIDEGFDWQAARFRRPIDAEKFRAQHDALTDIYRAHGVNVHYIEEQRADRPNAVFCRDLLFMTPEGAIVTRPAMDARRGEERYMAKALADLGVPIIRTICGSATFEGAMGLWIDRHTVVLASGVSAQTGKATKWWNMSCAAWASPTSCTCRSPTATRTLTAC